MRRTSPEEGRGGGDGQGRVPSRYLLSKGLDGAHETLPKYIRCGFDLVLGSSGRLWFINTVEHRVVRNQHYFAGIALARCREPERFETLEITFTAAHQGRGGKCGYADT